MEIETSFVGTLTVEPGQTARSSSVRAASAFTLIELLVVIAIIGILAAMLLPTLSRAKQSAQGSVCLNDGKQMMVAVLLYVNDNQDFFPPNPDDGNTVPGHNWCPGNAGIGGSAEFNSDILRNSLLVEYLANNVSLFRCPADKRVGLYQGNDPAKAGQQVPAARTFSMNQAVGTICSGFDRGQGHAGPPTFPVNGPWLDGSYAHRRRSPWRTYGKMSAVTAPGPSGLWVLLDENEHGLNDAAFAVRMNEPGWLDHPGTYHNFGCGFSFADGHAETHRWLDANTKYGEDAKPGQAWRDWEWIVSRTSARVN